MKHTQGEWKIVDEMYIESKTGLSIANVYWNTQPYHSTMVPEEEGVANVKLIAAAPDLLEALQLYFDLMKKSEDEPHFDHLLQEAKFDEKAKAAIKKATL